MKKIVFIVIGLLSLIGCMTSIDDIGGIKVANTVKVYIDNLSSEDIVATIEFGRDSITCGGIILEKNTTGSFIEIDFTKDSRAENTEIYSVSLNLTTTSGSAIDDRYKYGYGISPYNKYKDGIYMRYPRTRVIIKDSQSTESAFEVTRESY